MKFDKKIWDQASEDGIPPPCRDKMLKDLTSNKKLVGLTYNELIQLLGTPDFKDSTTVSYGIIIDYKRDIDPVYIKNLCFYLSGDSVATSFKTEEWEKGVPVK